MLSLDEVGVSYGTTVALAGISLSVGASGVVSLLGPNGAGKSTTLRAISRLVAHTGRITFDGDDLAGVGSDALSRRGLGHVPEGRRIFSTLSVHENLLVGRAACGDRSGGFSTSDVYDLFPTLARMRKRGGWALSGGEQQMLAIGRALVGSPRMLLLDEPSLGLAPVVVTELFRVLAEIKPRIPMLLVEQNTAMAMKISDRAYVLAHGRIVLSGATDELGDRAELIRSYLGQHDLEAAEDQRESSVE
jgi:branched-chain amino acid transport system ATP-binding protein